MTEKKLNVTFCDTIFAKRGFSFHESIPGKNNDGFVKGQKKKKKVSRLRTCKYTSIVIFDIVGVARTV